jgi:hypothetical protein
MKKQKKQTLEIYLNKVVQLLGLQVIVVFHLNAIDVIKLVIEYQNVNLKKGLLEKNNSKNKKFWKKSTANNVVKIKMQFVSQLEKIWSLLRSQMKFFGSLTPVVQITW